MTYVQYNSYSLTPGETVKHCFGEFPSTIDPPWITVSIRRDIAPKAACTMLRKLADQIEFERFDPERLTE